MKRTEPVSELVNHTTEKEPRTMDNNLVFIDTETTSLDVSKGQVIEVAWAVNDGPVVSRVLPHTLAFADPKALEVNRYLERGLGDPAVWTTRVKAHDAMREAFTGATVVAENYGFDCSFLDYKVFGGEPWHYRKIELSTISMILFNIDRPAGMYDTRNRLIEAGYIIPEGDHSAAGDVACLQACYYALRDLRNRYPAWV